MKQFTIAVVFGVFDMLHPGHLSFLRQALNRAKGGRLIVVVARDSAVKRLKGRKPHFSERERIAHVKKELKNGVTVVLGDRKLGTYSALKKYRPDAICLGYDQKDLRDDLRDCVRRGSIPPVRLIRLLAHWPRTYHTSFLARRARRKGDGK